MREDRRDTSPDEARTPVERVLRRDREGREGVGRPLSRQAMQRQRTLEGYLKGGNRPRWMERIVDIDSGVAHERTRLERAYRRLAEECAGDREELARRWRARAEAWRFDDLNELIRQHNEWFPIERQLPVDPRTRDYVLINGRSYRRPTLDAAWVLEQFPAG